MAFTKRYTSTVKSYNDTTYTVEIWDNVTTSTSANDFVIGAGGPVIDYAGDTEDKFNPLITSRCKIPFMVQSGGDANFINQMRSVAYSEKDVYILVYKGSDLLWGGFVLMELGKEEDLAYPYEVMLEAIDGLALLKNFSFIPEPTLTGPYDIGDTFLNEEPQTFIYWLKTILLNVGFPTTTQGATSNYTIKTAVNWYNEDHAATTAAYDPLALTRGTVEMFYEEVYRDTWADVKYEAPTLFAALKSICVAWGMRCIYWNNSIWFIQISEYNTDESGTFLAPVNITTRTYDKDGTYTSSADDIGTTNVAYDLDFEGSGDSGLQKLTGTSYDFSTPIKQVKSNFLSYGDYNYHVSFPRVFNEGVWEASLTSTESITTGEIINIKNASLADSFFTQVFMECVNSGTEKRMMCNFGIRAKAKGAGAWAKMLDLNASSNLYWNTYAAPTGPVFDANDGYPSGTGVLAFHNSVQIQPGNSTINILSQQIGGGAIPTDAAFTGMWEFQWYAYAEFHQPTVWGVGAIPILNGHGAIWAEFLSAIHLPFMPIDTPSQGIYVSVTEANNTNLNFPVWHEDWTLGGTFTMAHSPTVSPAASFFCQVKDGAIGVQSQEDILTLNDNTFIYKVPKLFWGDVNVDTPGALEVYNGAAWVLTDVSGKWGVGTLLGTSNFSKLVCWQILNNGFVSSYKFTGTSVLSETNKEETDGSGTRLKYINPIGRIVDQNGDFVFASGNFKLLYDEVDLEMFEMNYSAASPTFTTTSHPGNYSGSVGIPQDNNPNIAMLINSNSSNITQLVPCFEVYGTIAVSTSPITSITVCGTAQAIFKSGDVFTMIDSLTGYSYEITLAADYTPPSVGTISSGSYTGDWAITTTLTIDSLALEGDIGNSSKIGLNPSNLITEYQRKTMGTVGGFTITSETIGGWNSRTGTFVGVDMDYIKLLPSDFIPNDNKVNRSIYFDDSGTTGVRIQDATQELWAFRQVPYGKRVTSCNVWGNATRDVEVYVLNVDSSGVGSAIGTGSTGATGFSVTATDSTATNYIGVKIITTAMSDRIYGGKLLIEDIP